MYIAPVKTKKKTPHIYLAVELMLGIFFFKKKTFQENYATFEKNNISSCIFTVMQSKIEQLFTCEYNRLYF